MKANTQALEQRIKASGLKKSYICECMGVSYPTLRKKIEGIVPLKMAEIYVLCSLLDISIEERPKFFCEVSSNNTNSEEDT